MESDKIVEALDAGVKPVLYSNIHNAKCRVTGYDLHDPDGEPMFTLEVEGHGILADVSARDLFDDREPEHDHLLNAPEAPQTEWAWTKEMSVEAIVDQVKKVTP
jgi:hypothetical protein